MRKGRFDKTSENEECQIILPKGAILKNVLLRGIKCNALSSCIFALLLFVWKREPLPDALYVFLIFYFVVNSISSYLEGRTDEIRDSKKFLEYLENITKEEDKSDRKEDSQDV